jgi:hypothetical protein
MERYEGDILADNVVEWMESANGRTISKLFRR